MSQHHRSGLWTTKDSALWRKRFAPLVASGQAICTRCHRPIHPDAAWDVDHILSLHEYPELARDPQNLGPAHRRCNRSSGGKEGRAKQMGYKKQERTNEQGLWEW